MQKERKRRKRYIVVIIFILSISGVLVMLYPYLNQISYQIKAQNTNNLFTKRMGQHTTAELDDLYTQMLQYNRTLFETGQGKLVDAFSFEQPDFSLRDFGFQEEMIGFITIPRMNIELPIYLGASQDNLKRGAAHLTQTSLPIGGINSNAVIAAHRGMAKAEMFRHIDKLKLGDQISITNYRETLLYEVTEIEIIQPEEIDKILIQPGRDMVTLVTCNPYGFNYERYLVYAQRIE